MENKILKPEIRFEGFTDTWKECKFEDIFKVSQGLQIPISKRFIQSGKNRYFYITNEFLKDNCNEAYYIESPSENVICDKEDILMTRTGNTGLVVTDVEGCFHNNFFKIKYDKKLFSKRFICYLLSSEKMQKIILNSAGSSTIPDLSHNAFYNIEAYFPKEKVEQDKIANMLKELDNLITLHQSKYDKLVNVKKALLEKMFPKDGKNVPEVRFKGYTDTWKQRKLGEIGTTFTGLSGKTKEDFGHGSAKFVTYMNVFKNPIMNKEELEPIEIDIKQNQIKAGDVFFTTSSETPDEVGMSSVCVDNTENVYLNSFCFGYRPLEKIDAYYFAYMLRSKTIREKFILLAQGISRYNISKIQAMEIEIPLPNLEEQKLIGRYFKDLDNLKTLHQHKLNKLQNMKKSLLNKMFI